MQQYWLIKSEPSVFSFTDLEKAPNQTTFWDGVRNYQARNFMRDQMQKGDFILFYHSNCDEIGVAGVAQVAKEAYPDHTAQDKKSKYYDPTASEENPRWFMVDIKFKKAFKKTVTLSELKEQKDLKEMRLLQKGNRLSVLPVKKTEFEAICKLGGIKL